MKDAFERRALLLHLGRTLQLLARILETRSKAETIGELIELNPILEDEILLEHVSPALSVDDFIAHALRAFCCWPEALLDEKLDHGTFAVPVRDGLFNLNLRGWHAYATGLRAEVPWFGLQPAARPRVSRRKHDRAIKPARTSADVSGAGAAAAPARDIERDKDEMDRTSESVEGLSPARGARRENEQYLPEFE
ncbi:MAG TPA: hypothetical protein VMJ11_04765 [Paraburkholderia sp.]|uniref:hypothetical protein n=1 Tax=Paraburkholderia sp. TaxID=1926495 RepID=UPI002BD84090|nr:hypothetical protein [Paraburkholderia sp.]HTR05967.1 hypothetical protein [Paraburkholderia sp.]